MATITQSLVDARDEARQAEVRTDIAGALHSFEKRTNQIAWRIVGFVVGTGIGVAGLMIALLK